MHFNCYSKHSVCKILHEHDRTASHYENWVDSTRTKYNFSFANSDMSASEKSAFARKRSTEIAGTKLQDQTNIMTSVIVHYPKELCYKTITTDDKGEAHETYLPHDMKQCEQYFYLVHTFLADRYGKDNVISAEVHMDETTPHIHFAFVPEATSRKTGKKTVSSASLVTRKELWQVHRDLQDLMNITYGKNDYILNGRTKGDYTVSEMKQRDSDEIDMKRKRRKIESDMKYINETAERQAEKEKELEKRERLVAENEERNRQAAERNHEKALKLARKDGILMDREMKCEKRETALDERECVLRARIDEVEEIYSKMSEKAKNDVSVRSAYDKLKDLRDKDKKSTEKVISIGYNKC